MYPYLFRVALPLLIITLALPAQCRATTRNIIFMVADGMGLTDLTAVRTLRQGPDGTPLTLETLPFSGYQRTHSRNSLVTDSAAAASAWASGEKFNNGAISCHDINGDGHCDGSRINRRTILQLAQERGLKTGLVVTSDITHATPAAFGAKVHHRNCESEIMRQYLAQRIDILLGGGIASNRKPCKLEHTDNEISRQLLRQAAALGYRQVGTARDLALVSEEGTRLLGLFRAGGLTPAAKRSANSQEPTLATMTASALKRLQGNRKGFFLLVEGSQIDWAKHANDLPGMTAEILAFDSAVKMVLDWLAADQRRSADTLVIVASDHETGGLTVNGPKNELSSSPKAIEANWATSGHTASDVPLWCNVQACRGSHDNTELFDIMHDFLLAKMRPAGGANENRPQPGTTRGD